MSAFFFTKKIYIHICIIETFYTSALVLQYKYYYYFFFFPKCKKYRKIRLATAAPSVCLLGSNQLPYRHSVADDRTNRVRPITILHTAYRIPHTAYHSIPNSTISCGRTRRFPTIETKFLIKNYADNFDHVFLFNYNNNYNKM